MSEYETGWNESDSDWFLQAGDIITPSRGEQIEMLVSLVPGGEDENVNVVDLACGRGQLSAAILERFSGAQVLALDGSQAMVDAASEALAPYGDRAQVAPFSFRHREWLDRLPSPLRCVVSSLAIHHLDGPEKQELFRDLHDRVEAGGALLIIDLVEPPNDLATRAYADAWDAAVREQSQRLTGSLRHYHEFRQDSNHYATPDVEFDKPSGLFEQLKWLEATGFSQVDCFWLRAGHALYGAYK